RAWSTDVNMWKRRVSIICQLSFKRETDLELLYANIEPNLGDREFFIRKAIGWALRQYAWTDPKEVARYVRAHDSQLSGLSRRIARARIWSVDRFRSARRHTHRAAPAARAPARPHPIACSRRWTTCGPGGRARDHASPRAHPGDGAVGRAPGAGRGSDRDAQR